MPNWIFGTDASETVHGTDGVSPAADDIIWAQFGDDLVYGYGGNDYISGGPGADTIYGGAGSDTVQYTGSAQGVRVSLATGQGHGGSAEGDRLYGVENLRGSGLDDTLEGNDLDNVLDGWGGRDTLKGGGGDDHLIGDAGNDLLKGGGGADTLDGGADIDTASYSASPAGVVVLLELDHASGGDAYEDELNSIENLVGSNYDDHLWGTETAANVLQGGNGNDSLKGFGGADTLNGGAHNDTLLGGGGVDMLTGGTGADTFTFTTPEESGYELLVPFDQITDFSAAQVDKIDLSAIDADMTIAGNQAFWFIGNNNEFTNVAGQLRFNSGHLQGDLDGDGLADFEIHVSVASLGEGSLIL